jgi:predicted nuclease of restriction endonuclease-like (RecB) superfamily
MAETTKNDWTARQLERQINSQLFERLLLSNDKESVLAVAREEKSPSEAKEIIKDEVINYFVQTFSLQNMPSEQIKGYNFNGRTEN